MDNVEIRVYSEKTVFMPNPSLGYGISGNISLSFGFGHAVWRIKTLKTKKGGQNE